MKHEIADFVSRCLTCQLVKVEHQKPISPLQPLDALKWKSKHISMDFVVGFHKRSKDYDFIWVIIDRLMKSVHFFPI